MASEGATLPIISPTSSMAFELPMMLAGWKRSFSSPWRRRFSSWRLASSARSRRREATSWAIMPATIDRRRTFRCRLASSTQGQSTLRVPTTSPWSWIGTQMKELWDFSSLVRAPVRSRNSGSELMRGTITGLAEATTRPVIPSPTL